MLETEPLRGKIAVITGGAGGMGAGISRLLAAAGALVVVNDIDGDLLAATQRDIEQRDGLVATVHGDITEAGTVDRLRDTAVEVGKGRVDILVNNVGDYRPGTGLFVRTNEDGWRAQYAITLEHVFRCMYAFIPIMQAQGSGAIVNNATVEALRGIPYHGVYSAFNAGIIAFTKSMAVELGRDGIRVNSVCPAGGNVQMYGPWMKQIVGFIEETRAYSNNRGIPGEAPLEQIAAAVLFFASDASRHCTGVDLPVDGGAHAGRFIPGFNTL